MQHRDRDGWGASVPPHSCGDKASSCSGLQVTCSGAQDGARELFCPGSSTKQVAGGAPGTCAPCSSLAHVVVRMIYSRSSDPSHTESSIWISCGDISVGESLEAWIPVLHFQASGLRNAVKTRDPSQKTCPIFLPVQLGLTAQHWKSSAELHLFYFFPSEARSCFKWVILCWFSVLYMTHLVFLQLWQSGRWSWEDFTALFPFCSR